MGIANSESAERLWPDWPSSYEPVEKYETFGGRGKLVCSSCVVDEAVREAALDLEDNAVCGYCGGSQGPFGYDHKVFEYVLRCLYQEYGDPLQEAIFWDREDGAWIGISELDPWDLLEDAGNPFADGSAVAEAFEMSVEHDWFRLDTQVGEYHERLAWGWDSFEERLINGPRFLFSLTEAEMGEESAQSLFRFLDEFAAEVESGFVKICEPEQVLYRARADKVILTSAKKLGSPPSQRTRAQRMSAAGVSCFYAAEDLATAAKEISAKETERISVGQWVTTRPLTYADFASELELPSLFDYPRSRRRIYTFFLREFVERISRPADPKVGDANAYLGTQVLAEYLRYGMPVADGHGIDAVRYPSTAREGGVNWVIFGRPDRKKPRSVKLISPQLASG